MRNKILLILFGSLFYSTFFAQRKVYTDIQKNDKTYPAKLYSFEKVIDARANKDNIGTVYKSDIGSEHFADLNDPLPTAIMKFLMATFPNGSPQTKLIIVVNNFEIGHILTGRKNDTGFVKVNFDFYKTNGDSSQLIYNYTHKLFDVTDNIALTHSNRMKRIILMAIAKVDSVVLNGAKPYEQNTAVRSQNIDSIANAFSAIQSRDKEIKDSILSLKTSDTHLNIITENKKIEDANYPRNLIILIGGHAAFCQDASMYGANANFLGRLKKYPRTLIGFNINYSAVKFSSDVTVPANTSYKVRTSDFGFRLLRQVKGIIFYSLNPHMLIGRETFTTYTFNTITTSLGTATTNITNSNETSNLFVGCQIDNGIYFFHPKKAGPYFGLDLVLRFTNSMVFDNDIGIKLNLGIAF